MVQAMSAGNSVDRPAYADAMFPTPVVRGGRGGLDGGSNSRNAAMARGMFPSPVSNRGGLGGGSNGQRAAKDRGTYVGGLLNPEWVEWLMNWPISWTSLEPMPAELFGYWLANQSTWWAEEPPIPRTVDKGDVENRRSRLAAIGNGWVPRCGATAWRVLSGEELA